MIITCATCQRFRPNPINPEAAIGRCTRARTVNGRRQEAWEISTGPMLESPMPPYPMAERVCGEYAVTLEVAA